MNPQEMLDRDGSLLDWVLEAYANQDLDEALAAAVAAHFRDHPKDQARLAALRAHERSYVPPPFSLPQAPPTRRWVRWSVVGGAIALAAALLLTVRAPLVDDGWRSKGTAELALEAWVEGDDGDIALHTGDSVADRDRVGFRAAGPAGFLLVVGVDDAHVPYPAVGADGHAVWVDARAEPHDLGAAVRFDDRPGHERLIGMLCPHAVSLDEVQSGLVRASRDTSADQDLPKLQPDCGQAEIRLLKAPRRPPDGGDE